MDIICRPQIPFEKVHLLENFWSKMFFGQPHSLQLCAFCCHLHLSTVGVNHYNLHAVAFCTSVAQMSLMELEVKVAENWGPAFRRLKIYI